LSGEYWSKSYSVSGWGGNADWTYSEILIMGTLKYYVPIKASKIKPYGGAGLGLVLGHSKVEGLGSFDTSANETGIGFQFFGGAEMPLADKLDGLLELKYGINGDNADFFGIFAGVTYKLGK
jgi:opacity protein-like surface antigen